MQLFGDNDFRCYIDFQRKKGETIETFSKRFHFYYYVDFYIYD